jgi:hypothetical protein
MKISQKIRDIILSSLITLTVTLLGLLLKAPGITQIERGWIYSALSGLAVCGIFIILNKLIVDLREEAHRVRETQQLGRWSQCLPSFVVMNDRRDHFVFDEEGNATLHWSFDIDGALSGAKPEEILWPIFAEVTPDLKSIREAVKVEAFSVDGIAMNPKQVYLPQEIRERIIPAKDEIGHLMGFGVLRIPLRFEPGRTRRRINLTLRLEKSFTNLAKVEHVYVDVPILTHRLTTVLEYSGKGRISLVMVGDDPPLIATLGMVDTLDPGETYTQRDRCQPSDDGKLVWTTDYPKLGYRYKLRFFVDMEPPQAA